MANVGWLAQVVGSKRQALSQEIDHVSLVFARTLRKLVQFHSRNRRDSYLPENLMEVFFCEMKNETMAKLGFTQDQYLACQIRTINHAFGEPQLMASSGQKIHAIPYWNPTPHRINIHPIGLVKSIDDKTRNAIFYDFVEPGEHVMIPESYTKGFRHSTIYQVAPQLKPLPRAVDEFLDLEPLTYTEWCTYMHAPLSECCRRQVNWYEKGNYLLCTKCGNRARGSTF